MLTTTEKTRLMLNLGRQTRDRLLAAHAPNIPPMLASANLCFDDAEELIADQPTNYDNTLAQARCLKGIQYLVGIFAVEYHTGWKIMHDTEDLS